MGSDTIPIDPGGSAACDLRVPNDGPVDVRLRLAVTGAARPYSWVTPDVLSLGPWAEAVARVSFHVPRASDPPAGPLAFEVAATPDGTTAAATTVAGVLLVHPFTTLAAELATPEGLAGRHRLTLTNRGNAPAATVLEATADEGLPCGSTRRRRWWRRRGRSLPPWRWSRRPGA